MRYFLLCTLLLANSCQNGKVEGTRAKATPHLQGETSADSSCQLCFQTYGLSEPLSTKAMLAVFKKYGVSVKTVAGCVITDSLVKSVQQNNAALFAVLDKRYGAGTEKRIMAEAESFARTQEKAEAILRASSPVRAKEAALREEAVQGTLSYNVTEMAAGELVAEVSELKYMAGEWKQIHWKTFLVDTAAGTVRGL